MQQTITKGRFTAVLFGEDNPSITREKSYNIRNSADTPSDSFADITHSRVSLYNRHYSHADLTILYSLIEECIKELAGAATTNSENMYLQSQKYGHKPKPEPELTVTSALKIMADGGSLPDGWVLETTRGHVAFKVESVDEDYYKYRVYFDGKALLYTIEGFYWVDERHFLDLRLTKTSNR